jgi:hypothetical protein
MSDAIDAAMLTYQRARSHSLLELAACHAGTQQLRPRHNTVRLGRHARELLLRCAVVPSHYEG